MSDDKDHATNAWPIQRESRFMCPKLNVEVLFIRYLITDDGIVFGFYSVSSKYEVFFPLSQAMRVLFLP